ncbi:hypothetical protein ABTE47_07340 [Acinetobacter baumannii]
MTDLNKLRSEFEAVTDIYHCIYNADLDYYFSGSKFASDKAEIEVNAGWKSWKKAKAQAVPEGFKIVPIELSEEIAERLALERVQKPRPENDPVWVEIAERAYKSNLLAKKWELVREYKILTEASESGAEG